MIFSEQNLKKAYKDLLANPTVKYDEWKERNFSGNDVDVEQIKAIVELWNESEGLPNVRKLDANVRKEVGKGIQTYGFDECMEAIKHYSEILNSDYFLNYVWNIRTFFKQGNALPEFMDDGSKWLTYIRETGKAVDSGKKYPWSKVSIQRQKEIKDEVDETLQLFKKKFWPLITVTDPNLDAEEYDAAHKRAFDNAVIKSFPVIFAHVANKNNVYLDFAMHVIGTPTTFKTEFENVVVIKHGKVQSKIAFEEEFAKYLL